MAQGDLKNWKVASIQPLRPLAAAHAQATTAELNGPDRRPGRVTQLNTPEANKSQVCNQVVK